MSQYTIDFSCNHTEVRNIVGKEKDRQGKADWMARGVCSDCYKQQLAAKRQKEQSAQMATAAQFVLAELEGSEKQVAWAEKIRAKMIADIETMRTKEISRFKADKAGQIEQAIFDLNLVVIGEVIIKIGAKTSATWFIDNRSISITGDNGLIYALVPDCGDRLKAITADEDAQIEQQRQQQAAIMEQELVAAKIELEQAQAALTAQQDAIASEYNALQSVCASWSDKKIEGDWDEEMNTNGNRRMELESTTYQLRQKLEALESKIREQERELTKINA
jgi:hypothetical protein